VPGHIGDLAHNLDFERSIFFRSGARITLSMGRRRIRCMASRSPGSASGRLSPERAIIFVLRSRKLLLLALRLRSVLHTLVGMVMRMLV
jgi:hypothetical protein